jgi:hypothetical protein
VRTILQSTSTRIAICIALLLAAAGPASASTIGIRGATLIFGADLNEQLGLSAFTSAGDLFLEGATPEIATPGCVADGATGVRCALSGFSALTIVGSNLDDAISLSQVIGLNAFVAAKDGDDIVNGGPGDDVITGGNGDDVLIGGGGLNHLFGGRGNNVLIDGGPSGVEPPLLVSCGLGATFFRRRRPRGDEASTASREHTRPSIR